jgi:phosphoserine/homoserine phosphotransferase
LTVNEEGFVTGHILRLRDQKRKAVESFQRLNFRVIAIGDSFNDISMMKAAERGILMNPSEKVVAAHPEFPVCHTYEALKARICEIVMDPPAVPARELVIPTPLEYEASYRSMTLVIANVAGTFAPEPWPALQAMTGIEELKTTTASHSGSYAELMQLRSKIMRENGIKLQSFFDMLKNIEPLPGAKEFLAWLKPLVPRSFMLTDTFEEYALPVFAKLGHPMVFSNFLESDHEGYMTQHVVRLAGQKKLAVEEFQRLNFRIIAIGSSFNDIDMLKTAEHGILFNPSEQLVAAHPEIPFVRNYEDLKTKFQEILHAGSRKRKNPFP